MGRARRGLSELPGHHAVSGDRPDQGTPKESVDTYIGAVRRFLDGMDEAARLAWAQRQTFIALGNGLNGAKALGFDACPMEGFAPDAFAKVLGLVR